MNYYNEIKNKLIDNEVYAKTKDYSKERHKLITYFEIGRLLNEGGGKYEDKIIEQYSKKLIIEVGKKYNRRTLFRMKQFYNLFDSQIVSTMSTQLTWSHFSELLSIKDNSKLHYYLNLCKRQIIDVRTLREKIKNKEYERLPDNTKEKLINNEKEIITDYIKDPIIIKYCSDNRIIAKTYKLT